MRRSAEPGSPVVLKVGSSSLAPSQDGLVGAAVEQVADQVSSLWVSGHPTVLVTSGAVAAGIAALGVNQRPSDLPGLQAAAAVGQGRLMEEYSRAFAAAGRLVGQVLLTRDILANRSQYLHARDTLERLLRLGVVPIVNENDTVVVDELRVGDNDRLAAIVSHLVGAGMLVILTDTAGLYSADPRMTDQAQLLTAVQHTDSILDELRLSTRKGHLGSGGVATKVAAARMAAWSGVPTVIADAGRQEAPTMAVEGHEVGTWIEPHESGLTARKLWIAFGLPSEGNLRVDSGAVRALVDGGKSLLAVGVSAVEGEFESGAAVEVHDQAGGLIAKGRARLGSAQLGDALGQHTSVAGGEAIHRDDLVVLV